MSVHVSSTIVLLIRRSELYYTASGIVTLKQVSGLKLLKYNSINMLVERSGRKKCMIGRNGGGS